MTDRPSTFAALSDRVMARFTEGAFAEALAVLDADADRFADDDVNSAYLRACLLVRLNRSEEAIAELGAAGDRGLWYSETLLRRTPSFQPIQGDPRFERLVERFDARRREVVTPVPLVQHPAGEPHGALVALHGNGELPEIAMDVWGHLSTDGWMVVAPASSQLMHSRAAMWDDVEISVRDIATQLASLDAELHRIEPMVLVGFSRGADVALAAALSAAVPARRLLLVGPAADPIGSDAWQPRLARAPARRIFITLGTDDASVSHEAVEAMAEALREAGAVVQLQRYAGLGHAYPATDDRNAALEWLLAE